MKKTFNRQWMAAAAAGLILGTAAVPASAAPDSVRDVRAQQDATFARLDDNGDGQLSRQELGSRLNGGNSFSQADADRNGRLNPDEFIKAEAIHDREQVAAYMDDSLITARVKGSLLKEMKSLSVSVETSHGKVLLSGFVDNESQVRQALQLAAAVPGVLSVKNGLVVK